MCTVDRFRIVHSYRCKSFYDTLTTIAWTFRVSGGSYVPEKRRKQKRVVDEKQSLCILPSHYTYVSGEVVVVSGDTIVVGPGSSYTRAEWLLAVCDNQFLRQNKIMTYVRWLLWSYTIHFIRVRIEKLATSTAPRNVRLHNFVAVKKSYVARTITVVVRLCLHSRFTASVRGVGSMAGRLLKSDSVESMTLSNIYFYKQLSDFRTETRIILIFI